MGAGKKARSKQRKAGKMEVAVQGEWVSKAQALTPAAMMAIDGVVFPVATTKTPAIPPVDTAAAAAAATRGAPKEDDEEPQQGQPVSSEPIALVYHTPATLPTAWKEPVFEIFEANMEAQYRQNWGYYEDKKRNEIFGKEARYLVAVQQDKPVGFMHLRFELDAEEEPPVGVLYVYEIQLTPAVQRQGLGARMMSVVEAMATQLHMKKLKLTVFKTNTVALDFYQKKLGYGVDASSPSKWNKTECYEILSKDAAAV